MKATKIKSEIKKLIKELDNCDCGNDFSFLQRLIAKDSLKQAIDDINLGIKMDKESK